MSDIQKQFQIDIGREVDENDKVTYHAHFISVPDRKIGIKEATTINALMKSLTNIISKKEKQNRFFPIKEVPEPSNLVIVPNGASQIHS